MVRTSDGKLYSWGRGDSGELGLGNLTDRSMPAPARAADGYRWTSVVAGSYYSGALAEAGSASKTPAAEVVALVAKRNAAVVTKETAAVAKYTYSGGSAAAAADASGGAGEAAADPNALPPGWDYEYDGDGNIYFIGPDGEPHLRCRGSVPRGKLSTLARGFYHCIFVPVSSAGSAYTCTAHLVRHALFC